MRSACCRMNRPNVSVDRPSSATISLKSIADRLAGPSWRAQAIARRHGKKPRPPSCRIAGNQACGEPSTGAMALAAGRGIRSTRRGPAIGAARLVPVGAPRDDAELTVSFEAVYTPVDPPDAHRPLPLPLLHA